jgi:hypothetical protein
MYTKEKAVNHLLGVGWEGTSATLLGFFKDLCVHHRLKGEDDIEKRKTPKNRGEPGFWNT